MSSEQWVPSSKCCHNPLNSVRRPTGHERWHFLSALQFALASQFACYQASIGDHRIRWQPLCKVQCPWSIIYKRKRMVTCWLPLDSWMPVLGMQAATDTLLNKPPKEKSLGFLRRCSVLATLCNYVYSFKKSDEGSQSYIGLPLEGRMSDVAPVTANLLHFR